MSRDNRRTSAVPILLSDEIEAIEFLTSLTLNELEEIKQSGKAAIHSIAETRQLRYSQAASLLLKGILTLRKFEPPPD